MMQQADEAGTEAQWNDRIALGLLDGRLLAEAIELDHTPNWPSFPAT